MIRLVFFSHSCFVAIDESFFFFFHQMSVIQSDHSLCRLLTAKHIVRRFCNCVLPRSVFLYRISLLLASFDCQDGILLSCP